jgi:inorganic pyrophosphatase
MFRRGSQSARPLQTTDPVQYLDQHVRVVMDRPLGANHPKHGFLYTANYGYVPGTIAPDGDALDAYFLGATNVW